ncbi:28 kDa heat- and acid-stable phosphoprotein-like [Oppia nitens]|uniref:28 kDa heat- and acid-stable phosphoprotein-like n=1 Tax=Oppia nitens TaxID=1686743 RepID=UPI0023DB5EC3|nr:28 kDa heat- and acid-stable phosphoprotein-like [Oppia nitens]
MARGRGRGHKGQRRHFTTPEDIEAQRKRRENEELDSEESEEGSEDSDDEDDDDSRPKGVSGIIEIENPNRIQRKPQKNLTLETPSSSRNGPNNDSASGGEQLSRREREEIEKQRARETYQRLHAEGKTDQARADLARLAIIKQQREDAAKRREAEIKVKEAEVKAKHSMTNKALGKK